MRIVPSKALRLCTATEAKLILESSPKNIGAFTVAGLKSRVERSRKVRDKYRALARQQRGEVKGSRAPKSTRAAEGNENTLYKAELFDQTLENYQSRQQKLEAEAQKQRDLAAKKKAAAAKKKEAAALKEEKSKKRAATGAKKAGERQAKKKATRVQAKRKSEPFKGEKKTQASQVKRQASQKALGRRSQAARDSRR
jgi:hypothetical protein